MFYDIQEVSLDKTLAESGIFMSPKLLNELLRQRITIYKDETQDYITSSYYMCGYASNTKILH